MFTVKDFLAVAIKLEQNKTRASLYNFQLMNHFVVHAQWKMPDEQNEVSQLIKYSKGKYLAGRNYYGRM